MPGIFGDGQRGGIFGAKIDPRLQAELERRAALKRGEMQPGLVDQWHESLANRILSAPSKLFGGLVVDPAMDLATLAGDVIHGRQPTMAADPQTGEFHTDPRLADRAMNAAGMLTLGAGAVPAEVNSLRMGIRAYHGSPHDFAPEPGHPLGRFRSDKIGTGEGNQAFGYGHYTAEREGVAQEYRDKLTHRNFINEAQDPRKVGEALFDVEARDGGLIDGKIPFGPTRGLKTREQIADMFASGEASAFDLRPAMQKKINEFMKPPGKMYEVDIAADPEHFLDWDKPLSEQKLKAEAIDPVLSRAVPSPKNPQPYTLEELSGMGATGRDLYDRLSWATGKPGAFPEINVATPAAASGALREAGVPGIRYLDQGSRVNLANLPKNPMTDEARKWLEAHGNDADAAVKAFHQHQHDTGYKDWSTTERDEIADVIRKSAQRQTSNFVVFDDKLISILKKYGLPISAAGLAALSQLHPQEAQAAQQRK